MLIGRCEARLVYRPGRLLWGDVYIEMIGPGAKQSKPVHVTDIDMPGDQFDLLYMRLVDGDVVRVFMRGNDDSPYEVQTRVSRECLE